MFIYHLLVIIYGLVIRLSSLKNEKAKLWVRGRRNWRKSLSEKVLNLGPSKRIWVHCASYGEFEQGKPLLEALRKKHPEYKIILSFFSPSGFEAFKEWEGADLICYLPLDTKRNARDFINFIKPHTATFIKYEFWVNLLFRLKEKNIPTFLVSAVFKPHHPFFKWYGGIFRRSLRCFDKLFIQDEHSALLLKGLGIRNFVVSGDTRFDRVMEIKKTFTEMDQIKQFKGNHKLLVAGSTWAKDDDLVISSFTELRDENVKLVLVPHHVDPKAIAEVVSRLAKFSLSYSLFSNKIDNGAKVLVVDVMGLLSKIYHYADCSYIGGGFNGGLHNCLEAAVYGRPLTFYGEDYVRYNEAVDLVQIKAAFLVVDSTELAAVLRNVLSAKFDGSDVFQKLETYFHNNANVTDKVLEGMEL